MHKDIQGNYHRDGYVIFRNVLDGAFLDALGEAIFRPFEILARSLPGISAGNHGSLAECQQVLQQLKEKSPDFYLNAMKISQNDPVVLAAASHPAILASLKGLGLREPVVSLKPLPVIVCAELAIENGYNIRPPHQEWPVMQGSHNGVVVWFPLHNLTEQQSSLEIYPGSHRKGVLVYEVSQCGSRVTDSSIGEPVRLDLQRGDLVVFSAFTVHRSGTVAEKLRMAMSIRFDDLAEQSFIRRGYRDNTRLVIQREPVDEETHGFELDDVSGDE